MTTPRALVRDRRGAIYVEFIAAFMPILSLFLCIAQLADLYTTKLVVEHAAYRTARAGAVVFPDDPALYKGVTKLDEVRSAGFALLAAKRTILGAEIELPNGETYTRAELVEVQIRATTRCVFPIANRILCDAASTTKIIQGRAAMPAQAARYEYGE